MPTPVDQSPHSPADWEPAPAGTIGRLVRRARLRSGRRRFLKAAGGVAAGMVAMGGGFWVWRATRPREYDYGGILCSQVVPRFEPFLAGRLPEPEATQVGIHLAQCPHCGPAFEAFRRRSAMGAT